MNHFFYLLNEALIQIGISIYLSLFHINLWLLSITHSIKPTLLKCILVYGSLLSLIINLSSVNEYYESTKNTISEKTTKIQSH